MDGTSHADLVLCLSQQFSKSNFKLQLAAASMATKRPAAKVKNEPMSPAKKPKPGQGSEVQPEPKAAPKAAAAPEPEKATPGSASDSKPGEGNLPPPGRQAWKDVHSQCQKLARQGDTRLRSAWEKASASGTQQAKREFYYHVFLLDPQVSKKEVHKESLERLKETEKVLAGWMTKYQIAKLQGADPQSHEFKELADTVAWKKGHMKSVPGHRKA